MPHHVCTVCGAGFLTDMFGRRERDWIKNDKHCDIFCTLAHTDTIEGRSITDVVMIFGNAEVAARRVRNVFDAHEFERALKAFAAIEADRLENMMHNVEVRGPTAALSPEAPSRLPGSAAGG